MKNLFIHFLLKKGAWIWGKKSELRLIIDLRKVAWRHGKATKNWVVIMVKHVHKKCMLTRLYFYKMIKLFNFINWIAEAYKINVLVFAKILAHEINGFSLYLKCNVYSSAFYLFLKKTHQIRYLVALHLLRGLQLILNYNASSCNFIYWLLDYHDYKCNSMCFSFPSTVPDIRAIFPCLLKCISLVWRCCPFLLHFCWVFIQTDHSVLLL